MADSYKVKQLRKMLTHEAGKEEVHYGAHLSHWAGDSNPINIDAGGIRALIRYYSRAQAGNGEEDWNGKIGSEKNGSGKTHRQALQLYQRRKRKDSAVFLL